MVTYIVPSSSASYSSSSSLRPNYVAMTAVTFGRCPTPSHRHCYRIVDCRFNHAINVMFLSFLSSSSLRPHFVEVATVAFRRCPASSHHHFYRLVDDCRMPMLRHQHHIRHRHHCGPVIAPIPPSPPAKCCLRAAVFIVSNRSSGDVGERTVGGGVHHHRHRPCRTRLPQWPLVTAAFFMHDSTIHRVTSWG